MLSMTWTLARAQVLPSSCASSITGLEPQLLSCSYALRSGKTWAGEICCYSQSEWHKRGQMPPVKRVYWSPMQMKAWENSDRKERKERNLASSRDGVTRYSHHHGSSSVPLVHSSCEYRWWGCLRRLVTRPFIGCSGSCSLGNGTYPMFPQSHACVFFFSVLAPADRGRGWCLDTFSSTRYPSSNFLQSLFWAVVYSVSCLYLAGLPGGPAASWATNKLWLACQEVLQQALQTSFEAVVVR